MKTQTLSLADCYKILNIPNNASLDDVKRAYRKRAFELHPDLNPGDGASRQFQQLNEAYVILIRQLGNEDGSAKTNNAKNEAKARKTYDEQARQEQSRQKQEKREAEEKERREQKEREREERQENERREQDRRQRAERELRETERRERLKQEIERQETERIARQAQVQQERERMAEARKAAEKAREEKLRKQGPKAEPYRRSYTRPGATHGPTVPRSASTQPNGPSAGAQTGASGGAGTVGANSEGTGNTVDRETLLNDLLNDPFARRVYEDIYSEVQNRKTSSVETAEEPKPSFFPLDWKEKIFSFDLSGGMGKAIKGWFRSQIDEEQELFFPASKMFPGARIRLQIRRGFSGELRTVDITLPQDFGVGKPVRLKGMGRKVGRWQGDLYLTFQIKE